MQLFNSIKNKKSHKNAFVQNKAASLDVLYNYPSLHIPATVLRFSKFG
jgi:hypothetical protein